MFEFIQLMGLKRILFLVGLILYIVVILIILCLPPKKRASQEQAELIGTCSAPVEEDLRTPKDAHYCTAKGKNTIAAPEFETTANV